MVVYPGKYNAVEVPVGPPPRGDDLKNNGAYVKGIGIIQIYWVGGVDMEGVLFHHEQ